MSVVVIYVFLFKVLIHEHLKGTTYGLLLGLLIVMAKELGRYSQLFHLWQKRM